MRSRLLCLRRHGRPPNRLRRHGRQNLRAKRRRKSLHANPRKKRPGRLSGAKRKVRRTPSIPIARVSHRRTSHTSMAENCRPVRVSEQSHCHKKYPSTAVPSCGFHAGGLTMNLEAVFFGPPFKRFRTKPHVRSRKASCTPMVSRVQDSPGEDGDGVVCVLYY